MKVVILPPSFAPFFEFCQTIIAWWRPLSVEILW